MNGDALAHGVVVFGIIAFLKNAEAFKRFLAFTP
jgi:hypothetical protein